MSKLFPYRARAHQKEVMETIADVLKEESHLVFESCTGSGKTVSALAPVLEYALGNKKRVIYLTRTNAQQKQVITELRQISNKRKAYGVGIQGRHNLCFLMKDMQEIRDGTAEELSKLCSERKTKVIKSLETGGAGKDCVYYANTCRTDMDEVRKWCREHILTSEEFAVYCRDKELCPYELNKSLAECADVVTAPYIYFFDAFIRTNLLNWMKCSIEDIILIVDEAHNLPDYARELRSADLSRHMLQLVMNEASEFGDIEVFKGFSVIDLAESVQKLLESIVEEYVIEDDGLVPPMEFESQLMSQFSVTSRKLVTVAEDLIRYGETIRERKKRDGKLPRSYIHSFGSFLQFWLTLEGEDYVKLVIGGQNPRLECYCMDPSLSTDIVNACHSSIHMSGTLRPFEEYRDSIGLPDTTRLALFPSPFPKDNLLVLYVPDATTRFEDMKRDEKILERLERYTVALSNGTKRNTVFFFPSFRLMNDFSKDGVAEKVKRKLFFEEQAMGQSELMTTVKMFKDCGVSREGAVLFAVIGGRIGEGLDFPDRELEVAVLVGIPYPKPTAKQRALQHYYDFKFGKGWDYTVRAPTIRRMLQSIGRLIRNENDRGVAVILDRRVVHFREELRGARETRNPLDELTSFFDQGT